MKTILLGQNKIVVIVFLSIFYFAYIQFHVISEDIPCYVRFSYYPNYFI